MDANKKSIEAFNGRMNRNGDFLPMRDLLDLGKRMGAQFRVRVYEDGEFVGDWGLLAFAEALKMDWGNLWLALARDGEIVSGNMRLEAGTTRKGLADKPKARSIVHAQTGDVYPDVKAAYEALQIVTPSLRTAYNHTDNESRGFRFIGEDCYGDTVTLERA